MLALYLLRSGYRIMILNDNDTSAKEKDNQVL